MLGPLWLILALAAPAAGLSIRVTPTADPHGGAWRVVLLEETPDARKPVDEHPIGVDGLWRSGALRREALYRVQVKTEAGGGWYADEKPFEWTGSAELRDVRLFSSAFRGTLFLGKKRLSGRVTFVDRDGLIAVPFSTKPDGTFEGVLPRDGWWSVTVSSDRPHFQTTFDVKVDPVFRDGTPPDVEIRVVSKVIQGEIVDLNNKRVPVASLSVSGFQEPLNVEGGWFTWDRVVDGWMRISASSRGANGFDASPSRTVRVEGGWVDPGFLALEIRPTYILRGRAILPSGDPAPATRVRLLSSFSENRVVPADGRFQMMVRGGGENACLLVVDPSKAARLVPVPASETEQDVPVAEAPGTLSLEFTPQGTRRFGALLANGCKLSWFQFRHLPQTASSSTATMTKSTFRASEGAYSLCGLEYGDFDEDGEIPPDACVSGMLAAGGVLSLRLNP
jgi:hypothetical protein